MKNFLTILFVFSSLTCFAQKQNEKDRCPTIYKNGFKRILVDQYQSVLGQDTISITEVKYECAYSAFYTHKVMYDKFGKWHKSVSHEGKSTPSLVWENVQLFDDSPDKFTVITSGEESWKYIYASISILDESGRDVLSDDSPEQQKLIDYFKKLIRKNKEKNNTFYEDYRNTFNPDRWNEILEFRKNNP